MRIKLKYCRYCLNYIIKHEVWHKHINKIRLENIEDIKKVKDEELDTLLEEYKLRLESDYTKISVPIATFLTNVSFSVMFAGATTYWSFKSSLVNSFWNKKYDKTDFDKPEFLTDLKKFSEDFLNITFSDVLKTGALFLSIALLVFFLLTYYVNRYITAKNYLYKYFITYINDEIQLRKQQKDIINVIEPEKEIIKDYIEEAVQMNRNRKQKKVKR